MVSKPAKKRTTVAEGAETGAAKHGLSVEHGPGVRQPESGTKRGPSVDFKILVVILIFVAALSVSFLVNVIVVRMNNGGSSDGESSLDGSGSDGDAEDAPESESESEPDLEPLEPELPEKIDFQPVVEAWAGKTSGDKAVMIYDLDRGEIVGHYDEMRNFNTASLYKLFVVFEGYRRIESGEWQADDRAGSTGRTILECLDLAIRESNSPCAETLWAMIGHDTLDEIIVNDFKISQSNISSLQSNPNDITLMMKLFYEHPGISSENLLARMWDSFLNQPATTYNWRQGLPSGFSDKVKVYNKVGWDYDIDGKYWNLYHDAAIIEVPETNRHFVVVVMTHRVGLSAIKNLAAQIESLL